MVSCRPRLAPLACALLLGLFIGTTTGCGQAAAPAPSSGLSGSSGSSRGAAAQRPASDSAPTTTTPASQPAQVVAATPNEAPEDVWEAIYLQDSKIGYTHTRRQCIRQGGQKLIRITSQSRLSLERFGQTSVQRLRTECVQTEAGHLRSFEVVVETGDIPSRTRGHVEDRHLIIESTAAQRTVRRQIDWQPDTGGFHAAAESLRRQPLAPGERRTLRALMPLMLVVADIELVARQQQLTTLAGGVRQRLLRIESTTRLPDGNTLQEVYWTNRRGRLLKTRVEPLGMISLRVPRELAESEDDAGQFDLGLAAMIPLDRPLPDPARLDHVRYRVRLKHGDPATVFARSPYQEVRPSDPHTAEITVWSQPQNTPQPASKAQATPGDLEPNDLVQSDDPIIVALAKKVDGTNRAQLAHRLERLVHHTVSAKNFTRALASAVEVAESREGDCTEHAVLLAALARQRGIPARVAIGLVYVPGAQAFAYHMWNELLIDGRWLAFDATLPEGGSDAAHLKVSHSNLKNASVYLCFLPVAQLIGQLEIEVIDFQ